MASTDLPSEILHHIVLWANDSLKKKLLFCKPFHHSVLALHYAKAELHVLLYDLPSTTDIIEQLLCPSITPIHLKHVVQAHVYVHGFERDKQLARKTKFSPPLSFRAYHGGKSITVMIYFTSDYSDQEESIRKARSDRRYLMNVLVPMCLTGAQLGSGVHQTFLAGKTMDTSMASLANLFMFTTGFASLALKICYVRRTNDRILPAAICFASGFLPASILFSLVNK